MLSVKKDQLLFFLVFLIDLKTLCCHCTVYWLQKNPLTSEQFAQTGQSKMATWLTTSCLKCIICHWGKLTGRWDWKRTQVACQILDNAHSRENRGRLAACSLVHSEWVCSGNISHIGDKTASALIVLCVPTVAFFVIHINSCNHCLFYW